MGTELSKLAVGRVTVTGAGVGVGCAEATPLISKEAVTASVTLFQLVQLILVFMRMGFLLAANSAQNRRETVQQSEFIALGLHGWKSRHAISQLNSDATAKAVPTEDELKPPMTRWRCS